MSESPAGARWERIAEEFRDRIVRGDLEPGARLPSETSLAEQYDVCRMTAHRAMNELMRQGLVVRRRRVGTVVAALSPRKAARVAVLTFAPDDFPSAGYLRGLRQGLPAEWPMLLCDTGEKGDHEAGLLKQVRHEADAIVCFPSAEAANTQLLREIQESGTPIVFLDRVPEGLSADAVVSDNYGASRDALRRVTERGHRRIAHLTDDRLMVSSTRERYQAFRDALREVGEEDPDRWVRWFSAFSVPRDFYYEHLSRSVFQELRGLLDQPERPTAIFCLQDAYLAALLDGCRQLGISVPGELEIVSFNDCPPQFFPVSLPIVRILQRPQEMGRLAGERLALRLSGAELTPEIRRVSPQVLDWNDQATNIKGIV